MSQLSLSANVQYYLFISDADARRTFEGLSGLARKEIEMDPLNR